MEVIQSSMPLYAIGISLLAVVLIGLFSHKPDIREMWTILSALIKFGLVASMIPTILDGNVIEYSLVTVMPGLELKFRVDALGLGFAATASFLWFLTSFYAIGYVRGAKEKNQTRFFMCFSTTLAAAMGAAFAANMFTLFLFYEIITLCTFPLVAHKQTPEAIGGARKYLVYLLGTSLAFQLFAIFLTYTTAGTLDFAVQGILAGKGTNILLSIIFVLFMAGIAKAGMMPFHSWLPSAMVAPTPVSALLHAVAVVKVGVFSILRVIFFIFGTDLLKDLGIGMATAYFVSFTIITASMIALTKDNLKARLAYSTVSQLSYIILGAVLLTPSGMVGGIIHIANHAFSKITLFFCAGSIYVSSRKTLISQLNGIGRRMPWTMVAFFIASLSMIGVPPVAGFVSKWYLAIGAMEANNFIILIVLLFSTILNAAYFLPVTYKAFFKDPDVDPDNHCEEIKENFLLVFPLVLTAVISVAIGVYPGFFIELANQVIK